MKIEYFYLGPQKTSYVLIYGNEPEKAALLRKSVRALADGIRERVAVHEIPGFEGVDGCQLFLSTGAVEKGLKLVTPPKTFDCILRFTFWDNMKVLLDPFCSPQQNKKFQVLSEGFSSTVDLILSTDRNI